MIEINLNWWMVGKKFGGESCHIKKSNFIPFNKSYVFKFLYSILIKKWVFYAYLLKIALKTINF